MPPQSDDYITANNLLIRETLDGGAVQILWDRFWSQLNSRISSDFPRVRQADAWLHTDNGFLSIFYLDVQDTAKASLLG